MATPVRFLEENTMSLPGLSGDELMAWVEATSQRWEHLVTEHPEALNVACDVRETQSIGQLLQHIVAVELRYAQRLHGLPESPYEDVAYDNGKVIYDTHRSAMALLRQLDDRPADFWEATIAFATRSAGVMTVTRRTVFIHLLMHSVRHYAQAATLVRRAGVTPQWSMDYIAMHYR
jgi:uncharacterized damage-inducible protein DinB